MIIAIIQARMGSSRLPGKVLMDIDGNPMIKFMYDRVKKSKLVDQIIIATTNEVKDNPLEEFCTANGIKFYRGSENDVLDRYYKCAKLHNATTIVRLTADCPLIDSQLIDKTIDLFNSKNVDYASNAVPPENKKYPDGSDVEVFSFSALEKTWIESTDLKDREHVTFFMWKYDNKFSTALLDNKFDWGKYRITVDYKEDYELILEIYKFLKKNKLEVSTEEIINFLKSNPEICRINSMHNWGANW